MSQKPSIGRIVHYHSYGTPGGEFTSEPRAAIIAGITTDENGEVLNLVDLCVLNPTGIFFNTVAFNETPKAGCWSWPPRV